MAPGTSRAAGRDTISLAGQVHLELPREARDKIEPLAANSGQSRLDTKKQPGRAPGCLEEITGGGVH